MLKIAAALTLAIGALTAPVLAVPTMVAHTKTVLFNARTMHVDARQSGYCWTTSIASQRGDAFRCRVGNVIHDPCFTLTAHGVACPTDVVANKGIEISLTKPLPPAHQTANAWFMRLASGDSCNIGTGTTVAGYPYYCGGGSASHAVNLVCSAPPVVRSGPVFVRCADVVDGKPKMLGSYLVSVLYE